MEPSVKKVAAIHDLSGFGRASLCSIIPTLSTMGVQVCPVPTAILSTHSGGFEGYTFHDLTDTMEDYIGHWKQLNLRFECIYSGFLGSPRQIHIVSSFIDDFRQPDTLVVVDPVMGDGGSLYSSISADMVPQMRQLVSKADIIVPNFTEAAFLLGEDPSNSDLELEELKEWLCRLSDLGPKTVLITSAPDLAQKGKISVLAYERESQVFWRISSKDLKDSYPGTGDVFASVMIGGLLWGDSLPIAVDRAVQFISQCIKASSSYHYPKRDGVLLERELPLLRNTSLIGSYEQI